MAYRSRLLDENEKHHIKVGFIENASECVLSIHHMNSVFTKSPEDLVRSLGQEHRNLRNKSIGLCDIHLKADFGSMKYVIINIHDRYKMHVKRIQEFKGVEHILTFKR